MKLVNKSIKNLQNMQIFEVILMIVLVIYLVSGVSTPYYLAPYVNSVFMYASLFALVIVLFLYSNPLLAILTAIAIAVFLNRSKKVDHNVMKPSEKKKSKNLDSFNTHLNKKTLEQEIVEKIEKKPDNIPSSATYHPVLCSSHNAEQL